MANVSSEGAGAFETDFWKNANLRKSWDDIVPGAPRYGDSALNCTSPAAG